MEKLPLYINVIFVITAVLTVCFFAAATRYHKTTVLLISGWFILQAIIASRGFYQVTDTIPPRFTFLVLPPLLAIAILFATKSGRQYIDQLQLQILTFLHVIRIPVEMVLLWLAVHKVVPQLMTFEGRNFDVFSGLTAPIIFYAGFVKKRLSVNVILAWNFICLALLINIVINAILSAPFPFQRFAFDQPNIALLYYPYIWLPGLIVPIVLFSHLAAIRQLLKMRNNNMLVG